MRGVGRSIFVAILLLIAGILDIVYGIAAVSNSKFYIEGERYLFTTAHTWGWITIIVGVILLTGSLSLFAGGTYGQVVGIVAATIAGIEALLNVAGPHPWWSLGIFALCVICIHGLFVLGEPETGSGGYGDRVT